MSHRSKDEVKLPNQLDLARQFAIGIGREVQIGEIETTDRKKFNILMVSHGKSKVLIREENSMTVVFIVIKPPDEIIQKFKTLQKEIQERLIMAIKHSLISRSRTGYQIIPPEITQISDLVEIHIEQTLKLSRMDPGCLNRFVDAIQEVILAAIEVLMLMGSITPEISSSSGEQKPPDPGMYR